MTLTRTWALAAIGCFVTLNSAAASPPQDLSGVWVHRVVTTSVSKLPVLGEVENESRFYARVEMTQTGDDLSLRISPCYVRIVGEMKRVHTIIPDETLAVMGPQRRTGRLDGARFAIDRGVDVLGARLTDEWRDPLPDDVAHPAQWDEDGDGKPGVTVRIMGPIDGDVYVAQRAWNELSGTVMTPDRIVGRVRWNAEQQVLDATSVFLRANPSSRPHTDPARNHFEMRRLPPHTTCADIRKQHDRLFKGTP